MGYDPDYGAVTAEHGEIPDGEPVMILRAGNIQAPALLRCYRDLCEMAGSPDRYLQEIQDIREEIIRWQADHPEGLRVPGSEPGLLLPAEIPWPEDNSPASIRRPFPVGVISNGNPFQVTFPESVLVTGPRGSGKTNLENVFIAQLARCTDTLTFRISLTGGRSSRPWMLPWIEGHTPRPAIDWLATSYEEASLMLDALLAGSAVRARYGGNQKTITPAADTPAIILVADSISCLEAGKYGLAPKLAQYAETCRDQVMGLLRTEMRGIAKYRDDIQFGLRVTTMADGDSVFPGNRDAARKLARLRHPGEGLVQAGQDISPPVRFYRITLDQIRETARVTGQRRPAPEDRLAEAMGEAYEQRWMRPHGLDMLRQWRELAGVPEQS